MLSSLISELLLRKMNRTPTVIKSKYADIGSRLEALFLNEVLYCISAAYDGRVFVSPTFCHCFAFTGKIFRGMLHHVCNVAYDENMCGRIRTRKFRSKN